MTLYIYHVVEDVVYVVTSLVTESLINEKYVLGNKYLNWFE